MNTKKCIFFIALCLSGLSVSAKEYILRSPQGKVEAILQDNPTLSLQVLYQGQQLMRPSELGLIVDQGMKIGRPILSRDVKSVKIKNHIQVPLTNTPDYTTEANELTFPVGHGFQLVCRAYEEGVAYRWVYTGKKTVTIHNEIARYHFQPDNTVWLSHSTNAKNPMAMAFQNTYQVTKLSEADSTLAFLPTTIDCGPAKVTLLESDLWHYPGMFVQAKGDLLQGVFAPYPQHMDYYPWRHMTHVTATHDYIARHKGPIAYPWRIFAISAQDTQMPLNHLVYTLARPNQIGDTSWIKPGKVAWDWWNDWNLKGVNFKAGINYDTYCYYIDFAAKHHIPYIVLDEGWYPSATGDILHPIADIRLSELIAYGKKKGVDIVLWSVYNVMDEQLETICRHYADMGIAGFKVDFMDRNDQTAVEMVERIARCASKYHLILDFHGIYTPVGLNRTFPNILNYESVFGMEESRWTDMKEHDMPQYDVTIPFIRMMAGPMDFTPGAMRNGTREDWKAIYTKPISMGTRCHQAACYIVQDSPFTMLADSPTNYEQEPDYTQFIASLPDVFDEMQIPQGKLGQYIVTVRRKGNDWYIAGQTNWEERELTLPLSFLSPGQSYQAEILEDGINANHDAEDYRLTKQTLTSTNQLTLHMASGGGFVIQLHAN